MTSDPCTTAGRFWNESVQFGPGRIQEPNGALILNVQLKCAKSSTGQLTSKLVFGNFLENVDMISECCLDKIFNQNNLKLI